MLASLRHLLLGVSPGRSLRSIVGALAVLALLGAAGCGGGGGEAPPPPQEPAAPQEEPAAPRQETTADRATGSGAGENEYEDGGSKGLKLGCQLDQATLGMSPDEREDYRKGVMDEAYGNDTSPEEVLAERGFTC